MEQKLPELERETSGLKLFPLITILGWVLIGFSILISIIVLVQTASAYWVATQTLSEMLRKLAHPCSVSSPC